MAAVQHSAEFLVGPTRFSSKLPVKAIAVRLRHHSLIVRANDSKVKAGNELRSGKTSPQRGQVSTWFDETYTAWPEVHRVLTERNMRSVDCQEAFKLVRSGKAVLIDVREPQDFGRVHAQAAVSVPLFRLIQGNSFKANLRRLGHALITDFAGTERNPEFLSQALSAVNGNQKKTVVVMCDVGGTLKTIVERPGIKPKSYADPERRYGRASRSLRAVYELQEAGFSSVLHLTGGFNTWSYQGLPMEERD
ncbi:hypothetical protein R1sor_004470 [Riccia sorocarpa]|uniref:Rhodanese domain-containing protein n=1 Tax=Riccia sorocarpa TaxID=122646 RepID=A0ABD3HKT1_9MARC